MTFAQQQRRRFSTQTIRRLLLSALLIATVGCDNTRNRLIEAVNSDSPEVIAEHAAAGADIEVLARRGKEPLLLLAYQKNRRECFAELLKHGAKADQLLPNGVSLLGTFAQAEDSFWLQAALEAGADPDVRDTYQGRPGTTPLLHAICEERLANVKLLIEYKADMNHVNDLGCVPVTVAIMAHQFEVGLELLKHGANPYYKDQSRGLVLDFLKQLPPEDVRSAEKRAEYDRLRAYLIEKGYLKEDQSDGKKFP